MDQSALTAYLERVFANAEVIMRQLAIPYIIAEVQKLFMKGGEIYQQILGDSLAQAGAWYGMYTPVVYRRGYTFLDEGNIAISAGDISSDGDTWSAAWHVSNQSPHAGFSEGFIMPNRQWRPGGFIVSTKGYYEATVEAPPDIVASLWGTAVSRAVSL